MLLADITIVNVTLPSIQRPALANPTIAAAALRVVEIAPSPANAASVSGFRRVLLIGCVAVFIGALAAAFLVRWSTASPGAGTAHRRRARAVARKRGAVA